jgi:hypothetical protein
MEPVMAQRFAPILLAGCFGVARISATIIIVRQINCPLEHILDFTGPLDPGGGDRYFGIRK